MRAARFVVLQTLAAADDLERCAELFDARADIEDDLARASAHRPTGGSTVTFSGSQSSTATSRVSSKAADCRRRWVR